MSETLAPPPTLPPRLRRVPPGAWTALAWCLSLLSPALGDDGRPSRGTSTGAADPGHPPAVHQDWSTAAFTTPVALLAAALLRRRPRTAVALLLAATVAQTKAWRWELQLPPTALLAVVTALCLVTAAEPRRTSRAALAMVLGALTLHLLLAPALGGGLLLTGTRIGANDAGVLIAVIAWLVGRSVHQSREHAEALSARAAAQAVTAERLRIAREMHDTVAHSIGIVALQAGAARRVLDSRPDRAREALAEIETAGRETLAGLRRMLGALRRADDADGPGGPGGPGTDGSSVPAHGPPGLADLDRLAAATTAAGVRVDLRWQGERHQLPPEIDLAAFRIVQESLANVVRHAGTPSCRVTVDHRRPAELGLDITDRGRGRGTSPAGYGLVGLRERVALLHGDFTAAPRPDGGFRVTARLPLTGSAR
ncbi:sensor histidine kinase [Kitasatospora purpeofusca]|uniref:histidine kinase n=1 Tax=Kitasatospora purpeofusca TaxID=67352 RepID=A0ABZ1TTT9_9ACTN|nr:histidine kinase [Kitasatospora purpeofusca]